MKPQLELRAAEIAADYGAPGWWGGLSRDERLGWMNGRWRTLCDENGEDWPEEHWAGFLARVIVDHAPCVPTGACS